MSLIDAFIKIMQEGGRISEVRINSSYNPPVYSYRLFDKNGNRIVKFSKVHFNKLKDKLEKIHNKLNCYKLKEEKENE